MTLTKLCVINSEYLGQLRKHILRIPFQATHKTCLDIPSLCTTVSDRRSDLSNVSQLIFFLLFSLLFGLNLGKASEFHLLKF